MAIRALGQPELLRRALNKTGYNLESLVLRDIRVYSQRLAGHVEHWRDHNDHEVDIILTLGDGRWAAIEAKIGPDWVDAGADSLLPFRKGGGDRREGRRARVPGRGHQRRGRVPPSRRRPRRSHHNPRTLTPTCPAGVGQRLSTERPRGVRWSPPRRLPDMPMRVAGGCNQIVARAAAREPGYW